MKTLNLSLILSIACGAAGIVRVQAATIVWANVGSGWTTGSNWVGGTAPSNSTATDIASFGSGTVVNPSISTQASINGLIFQSSASAYTLGGSSTYIVGTGGISNSATNPETISANVRTSAVQTWTTATGGALVVGGSVDLTNNTGNTTRTLTVNGAGNTTFNGTIQNGGSGAIGSLTYSGTGALTLAGVNTYAGSTTLSSGTLNLNNAAALGAGTLIISGGTLDNTSGSSITDSNNNAQNWNGNFTFAGSNALNLGTGAVTLNANRQVTVSSSTLTVGGVIGGIGFSLAKAGAGTLTLTGVSTYSGGTTVSAGTLALSGGNNRLSTSGAITVAGGTLDLGGNNQTTTGILTLSGGTLSNGTLTQNGGSIDARSGTAGATLAGTAALSKSTNGTVALTGANTYSGGTTIGAGTLSVTGGGTLGNASGAVTIGASGTLAVGTGVTLGNAVNVSGILTGSGTAALGGVVSGSGTLGGTLAIASGGSVAPGNSPGNLTLADGSTLTFNSGSTYAWDLGSLTTSGAGTNFDVITLAGASTLVTNSVFLVPSFLTSNTAPNQGNSFWNSAHTWTVVDGTVNSTITGTFQLNNSGWTNGIFSTSLANNDLSLTWAPSAIPEPSTYAALLGAAALAGAAWHRRQRNPAA